jgi:hypothetical protein
MTLMLHAGAEAINYDGLRALATPEPTQTHVPIPHFRVVDLIAHSLAYFGHEVVEQHFGVTPDGLRFFGLLTLKSEYGSYTDTVGLRNSHDKRFPVGIAFGSRVFVCDNLAFIADHVVKRKHTLRALRDLPYLVGQLVEPLALQREAQAKTFAKYRERMLTDMLADHVIMELYRQGVVNIQRVPEIVEGFHKPPHEEWGDHTAWTLFNATTAALNGRVAENPGSTAQLHKVLDAVVDSHGTYVTH